MAYFNGFMLSGSYYRRVIPVMLMLTACLSPNKPALETTALQVPINQTASQQDYSAKSYQQAMPLTRKLAEESRVDTTIVYDLPALVDLALRTHPETKITWEEAKAAVARLERNRSLWYPTLTAMAFGQNFKNSFPIPGGPLVTHGYASYGSLDLAWTLFDFGRRQALVEAGSERLKAANFAFDRKHQEIAYRVANSFFAYQASLSKVTAAEQTFAAAKTNADAAKAKLDKGLATKPELLLAIQARAKANYDHQDTRGLVTQAHADLMANLGISPSYTLQLIDLSQLPLPTDLEHSVETLVDQALEQRPDLLARLAELRAREAEVKKARADFWPKFSLRGMVGNQYWGNVVTHPPGNESYSAGNLVNTAMLNMEWTLFDGFERSHAVHEAEAKQQVSKAQIDGLRLEIMRDIWKAYADTKTALEKREFAIALLNAAEASYAATKESYSHGFSSIIELISAHKDLAQARYTEIDSRANLLRSAANLVYVSGGQSQLESNTDSEALNYK